MLRRFSISFFLAAIIVGAWARTGWARTRPHYGGTLRVEVTGDGWEMPGGIIRRLVLDGLTRVDADGTARPALATEWKSDGDNHRWQFKLRPGVHFSDGTPLTSIAVAGALNLGCQANCPWTAVRAVGSQVVFTSDAPMPNLPALLAGDAYLIGLSAEPPLGIVGTGPFEPTEGVITNGIQRLVANESCWQGRPFLDEIDVYGHKPIREQWLDLSVGRADLVEVPAELLRQAQQQRLTVLTAPAVSLLALEVSESGALANPLLRQAIALAVDRNALSNVIFQKQGEVTGSLLPESLTGYAFLFPTERDLNKARELRGGLTPAPLLGSATGDLGDGAMQLVEQRIALNLREAGFNVQVPNGGTLCCDLVLRRFALESGNPQAGLEEILRNAGMTARPADDSPGAPYQAEREALDRRTLIPLLYLPRSFGVGGRVRDLRLAVDGTPDIADASVLDSPTVDSPTGDSSRGNAP